MKRKLLIALALTATPLAALAMPNIGDIVGTNPTDASAALKAAGCEVVEFEAEGGKIEAKCIDSATKLAMEVYIDPKTGKVTAIKTDD